MASATHEHHLNIRAAGKTYSLDFRQAFRCGYTLLRTRKFADAAPVFEAMIRLGDQDHLASIMLAYCKAGLRDFTASNALLCEAFGEGEKTNAEQLHATFVYLSLQMWPDAVQELTRWAKKREDLQWNRLPFLTVVWHVAPSGKVVPTCANCWRRCTASLTTS